MSFTYTPVTEEQIQLSRLLPEGFYPIQLIKGEDATSKAGAPMVKLSIVVFMEDGATRTITDYILPGTSWGDRSLFELCKASGLSQEYAQGKFLPYMVDGRTCFAKVGVQKGRPKDKSKPDGEKWAPDNKIKGYHLTAPKGDTHTIINEPDPVATAATSGEDVPY